MRFGVSVKFDPVCTTYADMEKITSQLRRFGVDDEGEDFLVFYDGTIDITNLLGEQAQEVIKVFKTCTPSMTVSNVFAFTESDDDVIYDVNTCRSDAETCLATYLQTVPVNQTRLEDFNE